MNTAHLRAIPTHATHQLDTAEAVEEVRSAELAARAEIARARRELPHLDDAV